jgi:hypothetical protein
MGLTRKCTPSRPHPRPRSQSTTDVDELHQAVLLRSISEEKRQMHMSVYDEMRAEGRLEGKAEGKLEFLVQLLTNRGFVVDDDLRTRLDRCTDEAQLHRWFDRALTETSLAAIFEDE